MRNPANRRRLAEWVVGMPRTQFGDLGIDPEKFVERATDGPGSLGSVVGLVYRMFAERCGKPRWGDRRPSYIRHIDVLPALFPDAQIVHLVRDGRDCVASLKEMPWFYGDVYQAVNRWAEAIDFGRRAKRRIAADGYHELRYEDLTADTENTLARLCAFLGEDYHPAMREPRHVADVAAEHTDRHAGARTEVSTERTGSWSWRLEPWEAGLCESVLGKRLLRHGYQLSGAPEADREQVAAYERTAAFWRAKWRRESMVERLNRFREPGPVAALPTIRPEQPSSSDGHHSTSNRIDAR